ncbi:MAG: DUF4825 domain-containing protein [Actinomycetaceae bacterium]
MMTTTHRATARSRASRTMGALAVLGIAAGGIAACGGDDPVESDDGTTTSPPIEPTDETSDEAPTDDAPTDDGADAPTSEDEAAPTDEPEAPPEDGDGGEDGAPTDPEECDAPPGSDCDYAPDEPLELTLPIREIADADALDANRTDTVGDNSAVIALVDAAGAGELGEYEVALQTDTEPYSIDIRYSSINPEIEEWEWMETGHDIGVLLLATIGNIDMVLHTHPDGESGGATTRETATWDLGADPLELGADRGGLLEMIENLSATP